MKIVVINDNGNLEFDADSFCPDCNGYLVIYSSDMEHWLPIGSFEYFYVIVEDAESE